jgi:hypothetical protein
MLRRITNEEREALRQEFERKTRKAFDQMFDPDRQADMVTFTERETRAMDLGNRLSRWLVQQHLGNDEKAVRTEGEKMCCPECGKPTNSSDSEGALERREIQSRAGPVEFERAKSLCRRCRRRFFPSGSGTPVGHGRI